MVHRIHPLQQHASVQKSHPKPNSNVSFKDLLVDIEIVKISKHAKQRMIDRNIELTNQQWDKIGAKMKEAKQKGITDSLVLTDGAALLASTTNHTIITVLSREEASSKIFTNINGTILID